MTNQSPTYFETLPNCSDCWVPISTETMRAELAGTYPNTDEIVNMIYVHKLPAKTQRGTYRRHIPEVCKDWAKHDYTVTA